MKIYTPQMLNSFIRCPKEYYYRFVENIVTPQLESNFIVGKNIHAIAAYYLKGEDISKYQLNPLEQKMWNNILSCQYFKMKAERVETSITAKIGDYWIGGRLDALVKDENDNYYILDYKTGQIPEDYNDNFQTIIYLLCCNKLLKSYNSLNFVYISAKTGEYKSLKLTKELNEKFTLKIISVCDTINKNKNEVQKSHKCGLCQYSKVCV